MVTFEEIVDGFEPQQQAPKVEPAAWEERLLDAQEIEQAAEGLKRATARLQLESLAKRLRKESEALKRVERSQQQQQTEEKKEEESKTSASTAASTPTTATKPEKQTAVPAAAAVDDKKQPATAAAAAAPPVVPSSLKYVPIDRFAFDAGGYNAPFVTLYIDLPDVGSISRENISCDFTSDSFDLIVKDLRGKSYRLCKDSLEKDIDPSKSKIVVKANKIVVKLAKVQQSDYGGYDYWSKLTDSKKKDKGKAAADPSSSIMDMMKQMYDEGDDNIKKVIGETMMKQRTGELGKDRDNDFMKDDLGGI